MRACPTTRVALVVEDEWILRAAIVSELIERGWIVVETATGEDALALLAGREVDIVLTDIQLAGPMNGWEVARAARSAKPDLPVIYASANASDPLRRVAGSLFFDKPMIRQKSSMPATGSRQQSDPELPNESRNWRTHVASWILEVPLSPVGRSRMLKGVGRRVLGAVTFERRLTDISKFCRPRLVTASKRSVMLRDHPTSPSGFDG
jgi:CheY-like chemotaxis protein